MSIDTCMEHSHKHKAPSLGRPTEGPAASRPSGGHVVTPNQVCCPATDAETHMPLMEMLRVLRFECMHSHTQTCPCPCVHAPKSQHRQHLRKSRPAALLLQWTAGDLVWMILDAQSLWAWPAFGELSVPRPAAAACATTTPPQWPSKHLSRKN